MKIIVEKKADGTHCAWPRGYRELAAAGRDYNDALDRLHDLLREHQRAGTLPSALRPDRHPPEKP